MKKLMMLLLALALLMTLVACGSLGTPIPGTDETTVTNEGTSAPDEETTNPEEGTTTTQGEETTVPDEDTTVPEEETTDPDEEQPKPHEHDWSDWSVVTPATCTEDGQRERSCACGEKESERLSEIGHKFKWIIDRRPTVSGEGSKHQECMTCGVTIETAVIPQLVASKGLEYQINEDGETCTITGIGSCTDSALNIPESIDGYCVTSIGSSAFYDCTSITSVVISNSVASIGGYAFSYCTSLTSVVIGSGVTYIGNDYWVEPAFSACEKLVEVYNLSSSITVTKGSEDNGWVGYYALDVYNSADATSKLWIDEDGYQFYEDGDICYLLGYTGTNKALTLPTNCNGKPYDIYPCAFSGCTSLTSVVIGDSVTSIGNYAFSGCTSLTSVVIGDSVTSIGDSAFRRCTSLTSVTIPDSVTSIDEGAFYGCTSLTSVVIGDSVTSIDEGAFYGCTSLTSIEIPDSVTSIVDFAFQNCTSLTSIEIPDGVTSIGDYAFNCCYSLASIVIPDSMTSIGYAAFDGCESLATVYYDGTAEDWNAKITIGSSNSYLTSATRYYYSETAPTTTGNYWHYVDGVPTKW